MMTQTSLEAWFQLDKVKLNQRQAQVLEALEEIQPATNSMLADHLKWPINTVTPRCLELRTKGKVVVAFVGVDRGGRKAMFYKPLQAV